MDPEKIRKDFPIFRERPDFAYLDNAATTQKPEQVIDSVSNFYRKNNANTGRGLYKLANDATKIYEASREKVADFIGAEAGEVIFVRNTTEAENLLASSLEFEGGIVLSEMAHHSEQLAWRREAGKEGKELKYIETKNGEISLEDAEIKIDQNTGVVAVSHISNVFGAKNPIEGIIELAHENGALVILDCAQSVPHMSIDVKELDVDFIAFSGHKMLGPTGVGVLYGKKDLLRGLNPYQVGGGMVKSVKKERVRYSDPPHRFEAGTQNIAGAVGLSAAIDYIKKLGLEEIHAHDLRLTGKIKKGLREIEGVNVLSSEKSILVSFEVCGVHPHDVAEVLSQKSVAVRAGNHCAQPLHEELGMSGTVRVAPYIYNTEKDVEKLLEGVKEVLEVFDV